MVLLKICFISLGYPSQKRPFVNFFLQDLARGLAKKGHEVSVVTPRFDGEPKTEFDGKVKVIRTLEQSKITDRLLLALFPPAAIKAIAINGKPDAIVSYFADLPAFAGTLAAKVFRVPLAVIACGGDVRFVPEIGYGSRLRGILPKIIKRNLEAASAIICVSRELSDWVQQLGDFAKKTTVIRTTIDKSVFNDLESARAFKERRVLSGKKIILFAGNLVPVKGVGFLVRAFAKLAKKNPNVLLVLVGKGALETELKKEAERLGVGSRVLFEGALPRRVAAQWIASSDVVVLPSLSEGMPAVALEALSLGKPVVASKVGGLPEIISSSNGYLVPPKDVQSLAGVISKALVKKWDSKLIAKKAASESGDSIERFEKLLAQIIRAD